MVPASTERGTSSGKRGWKGISPTELFWILGFCCLSLALFLMFVIYYGGAGGAILVREFDVYQLARNLSEGRGFTTDVIYPLCLKLYGGNLAHYPDMVTAPLFPLFLSIFFLFLGANDATVLLCGFTLYACGGVIVFLVSRRFYEFRVAAVATLLYLCNFQLLEAAIKYQDILLSAILLTLLFFSLRAASLNRATMIFSGILLGLTYLSRYELFFAIVPPSIVLVWYLSDDKKLDNITWFLLPFAIISFPFMIRNQVLAGHPLYGMALAKAWMNEAKLLMFAKPELVSFNWLRFFLAYRRFFQSLIMVGGTYVALFAIMAMLLGGGVRERKWFAGVLVMVFIYFSIQFSVGPFWTILGLLFMPLFTIMGTRGFFILTERLPRQPRLRHCLLAFFIVFTIVPLMRVFCPPEPWYLDQGCFNRLIKASEGDRIVVTDVPGVVSWYGGFTAVKLPGKPADFFLLQEEHPDADSIFFSVFNFAADWPPDTTPGAWTPFYASLVDGFLPERLLSGAVRFGARGNSYLYGVKVSEPPEKKMPRRGLR